MKTCPKCGFIDDPNCMESFKNSRATCETPWRCTFDRWVQYCKPDELQSIQPKLYWLIQKYGETFDDVWWYFYNKKRTYIKRTPIWMNQKRMPAEASKHSKVTVHRPKKPNRVPQKLDGFCS